jgi:filamentous hemagglutinin family protein
MNKKSLNKLYCAVLLALNVGGVKDAHSDVQLDNTIAPNAFKGQNIPLDASKIYQINANTYGAFSSSGRNVFFSFDKLTVESANTARFYCGAGCGATSNVISRIGPASASQAEIYGTLKSEIGGASGHFYLLSPNGVIFGQNAKIDVPGTFHAATTNSLKFNDGSSFGPATKAADVSSLDASPQAFGFLNSGKIKIGDTSGTHK